MEIQSEVIGILGTLGGTVLGWFLNNLSRKGRLNVFLSSWKDKLQYNKDGHIEQSTSIEETEYYTYTISLDLYNSSGETKIMRNIKVIFSNNKEKLYVFIPKDDRTKRSTSNMSFYDDVSVVNIPAKSVVNLNMHNGLWNNNNGLDFLWKTNRIFFVYTDENNKQKKILIKKVDYKNCFKKDNE